MMLYVVPCPMNECIHLTPSLTGYPRPSSHCQWADTDRPRLMSRSSSSSSSSGHGELKKYIHLTGMRCPMVSLLLARRPPLHSHSFDTATALARSTAVTDAYRVLDTVIA